MKSIRTRFGFIDIWHDFKFRVYAWRKVRVRIERADKTDIDYALWFALIVFLICLILGQFTEIPGVDR